MTHVGANFTDPANTTRIEARTLFGAGAAIDAFERRWRLSFAARDVTDVRPKDVIGFPLPGRSFALELTYRTERAQ